jgi:ABC-type transport system involved in cytochrome bd biosynthesis fused ATPase/permease subunit
MAAQAVLAVAVVVVVVVVVVVMQGAAATAALAAAAVVVVVMVQLKKTNQVKAKTVKHVEKPFEANVKRIHARLRAPVDVKTSARGSGQIVIRFKNEKEFMRIADLLER